MARKKIGKILSGGVLILCLVLLNYPGISAYAGFGGTTVQITISGSTGVSGVTLNGFPGGTVMTDDSGYYSTTVDFGWSGTITPSRRGYIFEPSSKTYSSVQADRTNEDYQGTLMTFTIAGNAGMDGVEMNGLPGNPVSTSGGMYSATVSYGWNGTVTPQLDGYTFSPLYRTYDVVTSNQQNQNYNATQITFAISGSTSEPGVVLKGLPGDPTSGPGGRYSVTVKYGWSGIVTPTKEGYEFSPPSLQYNELVSAQTNQDYIPTQLTYMISGTCGMQGVQMKNLPGEPITDETGYFSAIIPYGWSGTVIPEKPGFTFEPASMTFSKIKADKTSQDFQPSIITLTISGNAGMDGVEMIGLPGNPVTTGGGLYTATVDYGWNGTVTPQKEGFEFTPPSREYSLISRDQLNQPYKPSKKTFAVSGMVMGLSGPVEGVIMKNLPGNTKTDRDGIYTAMVEWGFTSTVTPYKEGYEFEPASRPYTDVINPEANQDYSATVLKRVLSGTVTSDKGEPVDGVTLTAEGDGYTVTDYDGKYQLEVDYGWRGTVTPTKEGYTFRSPNRMYGAVTREQVNQNYTAILKTFKISGTVIISGVPVEGVTISANAGGGSDVTDSKGQYDVVVPYNWTGEITPTKPGIIFDPPSQTYTSVTQDYKDNEPVIDTSPLPRPPTTTPPVTQPPSTRLPGPTQRPEDRLPQPTPTIDEKTGLPLPKTSPPTPVVTEGPGAETEDTTDIDDEVERRLREILEKAGMGDKVSTITQRPTIEDRIPAATDSPLITNSFDDDIPTALRLLSAQAGIPILYDDTVDGVVACDIENETLDVALEIILAGTPFVVKKTPYYYIVASGDIESPMFAGVSTTRQLNLNYVDAQVAMNLLSTVFQKYVQAEPDGNTLVVTAPPKLMERIVADVMQIDELPTHVLLDARIVVIERGDLLNLGVEWGWPQIQAGLFSNSKTSVGATLPEKSAWGIQIGYAPDGLFTSALELTLNLLSQNNEARILAKPQVLAQDGKQAVMQVTNEEYYMLTAQQTNSYYAYSELATIESGTSLTITPHIGDNNDITLEVLVEVSDSIPRGAASDLPVVTRRRAQNTVRIKDGGTVALAGLSENRSSSDMRRVPGLSKLPLIGGLFNSTNRQSSNREIAVFITAHIVPNTYRVNQADQTGQVIGGGQFPTQQPQQQSQSSVRVPAEGAGDDFTERLRDSLMRQNSFRQ